MKELLKKSIKQSKFNYILSRKRNILTFILLVMLVKPIFHYVFVEEKGEISENVVILGKQMVKTLCLNSNEAKLYIALEDSLYRIVQYD